jgi:hypothetical protein
MIYCLFSGQNNYVSSLFQARAEKQFFSANHELDSLVGSFYICVDCKPKQISIKKPKKLK